MTPKQIIATATKLLRLDEVTEVQSEQLLSCLNIVYSEIAADYIPLITSQEVTTHCGRVEYASLNKTPLNIICIKSGGKSHAFDIRPSHFTAPIGTHTVTYSYLPEEVQPEDELEYATRISPTVFAYGVASEYCLIEGDYEESQMWERRYRDALHSACRTKKEMRIPPRAWY